MYKTYIPNRAALAAASTAVVGLLCLSRRPPLVEPPPLPSSGAATYIRAASLLESHVRSPLLYYLYHNSTAQNSKLLAYTG
jgi:hypothetical protein